MKLIFSVIIAAYNSEKWLNESVDSLIKQDLDFENNIEVIIVDDASNDSTKSICQDYVSRYPNNFKYIRNSENRGPSFSRNIGLENATGQYINFLDSDDNLSKNTLKDVLAIFNNHSDVDLVSVPIYFFEAMDGEHYLNYKFDETRVVNLLEHPEYYQLSGPSSFIRKDAVGNIRFPDITTSEDVVFVNEVLINNPNIGLCKTGRYNYRKRKDKSSIIDNSQLKKGYYADRCNNYFKHLIDKSLDKYGKVAKFIQNVILYDIRWMLEVENIPEILDSNEMNDFKNSLKEVLSFIDENSIMEYDLMDDDAKLKCLFAKYGKLSAEIVNQFDMNTVFIDVYDIIDNELYVLANVSNIYDREIDVYVNNQKIETRNVRFPQRDKYCIDSIYSKDHSFEFRLPLSKEKDFEIEFRQNNDTLDIDFSRPCNFSRVVGYAKTKDYLSILKENKIIIEKKTTLKWIKQEIKTIARMLKKREAGFHVGVPFRIAYMLGYPFLRNKHIWFYMDRPEVSDDNGEHLFKYAVDKDPNIKKYFIIRKDSKDFDRMKKIGNVIGFKSMKHRYLGMFAENIVTSHPDNEIIYPFWGRYPYFAGLLKSNNVFLQHGIIKEDISSWLNKTNMNLSFFLTSAKLEYESIFKYPYNYDENVVQLLGLPRYDNLENQKDKKQIVIMPSWRRNLDRKSHDYIKESEYFKRFNSLINSERLIEKAREYNYEIIFRPHPKVYAFIDMFDKNDYVKIDYDRIRYQTLFNSGSLLITDYSSVAFDFAYLYKPVIYYHYSDDYHFDAEHSFFDYKTMGLGEIANDEDYLIDLIVEYMENDCKIKEEYYNRIKDFYLFTDKNNCKRVYEAIKKIPLKD